MAARILKGELVTVRCLKKTEQFGHEQEVDAQDLEAVIAKTKLTALKLLNETKQQAKKVIKDAEQEAEEILARAGRETEAIKEKAAAEGYESGCRKAEQALINERQQLDADRLAQEKQIEQERLKMLNEFEPAIIQMALQIAKVIIHAELELNPEQAINISKAVLSKVSDLKDTTLKVNPEDYNAITELCQSSAQGLRIKLEMDDALEKGDCTAETPFGVVDGTIDGQIGEVERRFLEVAGNG